MTALGKGVDKSYKTRYLHSINNADSNAGDTAMSQCSSSLARTRDLMPATSNKLGSKVREQNTAHESNIAFYFLVPWSRPGMTVH